MRRAPFSWALIKTDDVGGDERERDTKGGKIEYATGREVTSHQGERGKRGLEEMK